MDAQFNGYYRYPTIFNDQIAFVSEDDIWLITTKGGIARRLTTNLGEVSDLAFSEDGKWIAFTGRDEGVPDTYIIPSNGGTSKRLTFLGCNSKVVGWHNETVIFSTNYAQPFKRITELWEVAINDKTKLKKLEYGLATEISFGKDKGVVLGRKTGEPARWKNYRGGTAGEILIDVEGNFHFKKLINLKSNFANPMWIGNRIYFVSDHEDVANIFSCLVDGSDLKKHTHHKNYYVRNAKTDGENIVYHVGADIYVFNVKNDETKKIDIKYLSGLTQRNRKFVDPSEYFESFNVSKKGEKLLTTHRGKAYYFENWFGPVKQIGKAHGVRYRLSTYLNLKDEEKIVTISDENNEEHIEIHNLKETKTEILKIKDLDLGRVTKIIPNPNKEEILLTNQRNELILIDLGKKSKKEIDKSDIGPINGFAYSPDGRWIAYSKYINRKQAAIMIYDKKEEKTHQVTEPVLLDVLPTFDPHGKYLYFLSYRTFNPVSDNLQFNFAFVKGVKPYLITLKKDAPSPFQDEGEKDTPEESFDKKDENKENMKLKEIEIDFENITDRILQFPVSEERYLDIEAAQNKIFYTIAPVKGELDNEEDIFKGLPSELTLKYYDFLDKEEKTFLEGVSEFKISNDTQKIAIRIGNDLRILSTSEPPASEEEKDETKKFNKKTGWIDLSRIKVEVDPISEWKQMLCEAWRLQKFYFWNSESPKVNWDEILNKYIVLVNRIGSRTEFSDLIWEMQGELKTSHAYEIGGDYKPKPTYKIGYLGVDLEYDETENIYRITHILKGDPWDNKYKPPLIGPALDVKESDYIVSINGKDLKEKSFNELLVNYNNQFIEISIVHERKDTIIKKFAVKTLSDETPLRYREWVEKNKKYVHEKTNSKVGYVHIPDMEALGYSEFHRYYLNEIHRDAIIVDVRFNSGGSVSSLILEKLNRKFIGYDFPKWMAPEQYQYDSVKGPIVAVTNEFAGSDGDIFSHSFKMMKLGKLIGKRTWGGVVGIWPRNSLVDFSITTQPEMAFWFKDVGWGIENYGTDPDIEVDIMPKDYKEMKDPQLDKAIEIILDELEKNSPIDPHDIKKF